MSPPPKYIKDFMRINYPQDQWIRDSPLKMWHNMELMSTKFLLIFYFPHVGAFMVKPMFARLPCYHCSMLLADISDDLLKYDFSFDGRTIFPTKLVLDVIGWLSRLVRNSRLFYILWLVANNLILLVIKKQCTYCGAKMEIYRNTKMKIYKNNKQNKRSDHACHQGTVHPPILAQKCKYIKKLHKRFNHACQQDPIVARKCKKNKV